MKQAKPMTETELIRALRRLNSRWPEGYELYAANGTLNLMRLGADGMSIMLPSGAADPGAIVDTFGDIRCDGGDW